ncbi:MAG TPA: radical SAM protein [Anaerolineae bacterium]|nr:radical SAM protein [Anaerolineae bacterium]
MSQRLSREWAGARKARGGVEPLGFAEWRSVLDKLVPHAQRFKLTGGEPTLHLEFQSIVEYIDVLGVEFVVFTNGRWPDSASLLDTLANTRWLVGFLVSLHGAHAGSHEAFTGVPGSFEETLENTRRALGRGITVTVSTVLTRHNLDEVAAIAELAERLGAHHVVFNRFLGADTDGIAPLSPDLAQAVRDIAALRRQGCAVRFGNCIPQCFIPNDSSGCLAGVAYCAVDPWGNVRPCTHSSLIAGNLLEQSLEEVWFSSAMEDFRGAISPLCHRCQAFVICHGGCKALAMEQGLEVDPLARPADGAAVSAPQPFSFHPDHRPLGRFVVRKEERGLVLLRGNQVLLVRNEAAPLLAMLDGRTSLLEIQQRFGSSSLSLIGTLYRRGLISLQ